MNCNVFHTNIYHSLAQAHSTHGPHVDRRPFMCGPRHMIINPYL